MKFTGKIALVTGASRGIGRAIATQLAEEGAFVIGTATSTQGAQAITAYFAEAGFAGHGFELDVLAQNSIDTLASHCKESTGYPDIVVNNAGITKDNLMLLMSDKEWEDVIDTNLNSIYRISKAFLKPMFRKRWGRIINISSIVGSTGNSGQANYAAAKAGMVGFSKSLAQEIASRGVTVNVVSPGFIDTDMTTALPEAVKEGILKQVPMRRLGQAQDIAKSVAFLASDDANYITGVNLHVNGGMYMA